MTAETRKDVVAMARLIAEEEDVFRRCEMARPRIAPGVLQERIERVAREALAHAVEMRRVLNLPAAEDLRDASGPVERGEPVRPPEIGAPLEPSGVSTWQALVECVRIEERLADGYREAAAQTSDAGLRDRLGRLASRSSELRNEVALVASLVTSFVP